MIVQALLVAFLVCGHGSRALRPYEPLDEDSNSGIPGVHAAPAFGDGKDGVPPDDVVTQEDDNGNAGAPITRQQSYHFSYQIRDKEGNTQHHSERSDSRNNRKGSYGFRDRNGLYRHVTYVADRGGFRAWIKTNEPGTSSQDPADVQITAEKPPPKVVEKTVVADMTPAMHPSVLAEPAEVIAARPAVAPLPAFADSGPVHRDVIAARPAVAAVPAFTDPGFVPVRGVRPSGVVATPVVGASPSYHPTEQRPVAPIPAIDIATGYYPTYDSRRLGGYSPAEYDNRSPLPVQDYRRIPEDDTSDFGYYPEPQRIQKYTNEGRQGYYAPQTSYSKQVSPNAVPVYKSVRPFPTLSSSEKKTDESTEVTHKHGIPVGVTYINPQEVNRPFEHPQSFDIAPSGVATRYKKYLDWNRQGKLRD
ncbi:uncharacterized protein LOC144123505 [Amblyomma americanum]